MTLDGHPLYYFAADETADDVNGQGVGDVWYVVSPEGEASRASNLVRSAGHPSGSEGRRRILPSSTWKVGGDA